MAAYPTEGSAQLRCSPWLGSSLRVSYCLRYTMCLPERELKEHIKAPVLRKQVLLLLEREGNDKRRNFISLFVLSYAKNSLLIISRVLIQSEAFAS